MTRSYYVVYVYQEGGIIGYGSEPLFVTGPVSYRTIVHWQETIQELSHPTAKVTILSWQEISPDV